MVEDAGVLGVTMLHNQTTEQVEDRVYRLYYNEGQNRTDLFSQVQPPPRVT